MNQLKHHGILKQQWGVRNGPPYPLRGGDYSPSERYAIYEERKKHKNSLYNKKHFDSVLEEGTTLSTLSFNKNRTKDTDYFYATWIKEDKHYYNANFNFQGLNPEGKGQIYKYRIDNKIVKKMNIASEDSGAKIFAQLFKKDRDLYNFVSDPDRMQKYIFDGVYKHKGYAEVKSSLEKIISKEPVSEDDVKDVYRLFNYVLPADGRGDSRIAKDVLSQRTKFFNACKEAGYGAVLDVNDAIYGSYKTISPVIVFDFESIIPDKIMSTSAESELISGFVSLGYRLVHRPTT